MAFLKTDTLDGILATFTKTATRLEAFAQRRESDAALLGEEIETKRQKQADAQNDVTRAKHVRGKLADLIAA